MIVLMRLIWAAWRAVTFSKAQKATGSPEFCVDAAQSRKRRGTPHFKGLRRNIICRQSALFAEASFSTISCLPSTFWLHDW